MSYIHTGRRLSDPLKNARLFYVLEPFLPEDIDFGQHNRTEMEHILELTKEWKDHKNVVANLILYRTYHEKLLRELERLKGRNIIFIPG
ncbi:hypothetical protein KY311_04950 [Candidatus Woesearchaeota archaeon]|nr:hypothetical protein [Candidatus Woesearchaeota archaeon]